MPDEEPTVAVPVALLLQVPPVGELAKVIVEPTHTAVGPVITAGNALTLKIAVVLHPIGDIA